MSDVNEVEVAILRGVKSCGNHHEENALAPAVQFAQQCDACARRLFAIIWNAATDQHVRSLEVIEAACKR